VHAVTHATGSCSKTAQPSHTAANTVAFLKNQNVHLRRGLQTDPTSIQWIMLCVCGVGVGGGGGEALQQRVYLRRRFESVDELKINLDTRTGTTVSK